MSFPEHDWRLLRSSHPAALGRYCARVLEECAAVMQDADSSAHDRYLRLFRLIKERDERIVAAFDDLRRSTTIQRLAAMINLGVMTDVELAQFSRAIANQQQLWRKSWGRARRAARRVEHRSCSLSAAAADERRRRR